ncbi:MAG: DUF389 domain-containing protein [Thermodesulfobacteriota bacterium]
MSIWKLFHHLLARYRVKTEEVSKQVRFAWFKTSPERLAAVTEDIRYGSEPKKSFYAMMATACLIASFGLIANSAAVIISAMLVCPLMTPMLGMALALVLGDMALLGRSLQSEIIGICCSIAIATLLGLPLALKATPEMIALTTPSLFDLLVAVLAGFAGTFALIDARLSPVLPGVAIATSIMPPLANTGLCLAAGAYQGAIGSFLVFLANFLAILIVAAATFIAAGMAPQLRHFNYREILRSFGVPIVSFVLLSAYLTYTLVVIVQERNRRNAIQAVITTELSRYPATSLSDIVHQISQDKIYVLATVLTPQVIPPDKVKIVQEALVKRLGKPTELIMRSVLSKDIEATGSTSQVTAQNLDGCFLTKDLAPEVVKVHEAEQALREVLTNRPDLILMEVVLLNFPRGPTILATIQGSRVLIPAEIQKFQKALRDRLGDPQIQLLVRNLLTVDVDEKGGILYGWAHLGAQSPEEQQILARIEAAVREEFKKFNDVFATNIDAAPINGSWGVRVEVAGARILPPKEVARLEKSLSDKVKQKIKLYFKSRLEAMVTSGGYVSLEEFTKKGLLERQK